MNPGGEGRASGPPHPCFPDGRTSACRRGPESPAFPIARFIIIFIALSCPAKVMFVHITLATLIFRFWLFVSSACIFVTLVRRDVETSYAPILFRPRASFYVLKFSAASCFRMWPPAANKNLQDWKRRLHCGCAINML